MGAQANGTRLGEDFEYNGERVRTFYWNSDVTRYREDKREFQYLFNAATKIDNVVRETKGFTSLKCAGVDKPTGYTGNFVDVIEIDPDHPRVRSQPLSGVRIAAEEAHLFDSDMGRKMLAKKIRGATADHGRDSA